MQLIIMEVLRQVKCGSPPPPKVLFACLEEQDSEGKRGECINPTADHGSQGFFSLEVRVSSVSWRQEKVERRGMHVSATGASGGFTSGQSADPSLGDAVSPPGRKSSGKYKGGKRVCQGYT